MLSKNRYWCKRCESFHHFKLISQLDRDIKNSWLANCEKCGYSWWINKEQEK